MTKQTAHSIRPYYCCFLIALITLFEGCPAGTEPTGSSGGRRVAGIKYPYEMDADQQKKLCDKVASLRQGDTYSDVVKLLGTPTCESVISSYPSRKPGPPKGVRLDYYIRKLHSTVSERDDRSITIDFNNDKRLVWIGTRNLRDLFKRLTRVDATQTYWDEGKMELKWETVSFPREESKRRQKQER